MAVLIDDAAHLPTGAYYPASDCQTPSGHNSQQPEEGIDG